MRGPRRYIHICIHFKLYQYGGHSQHYFQGGMRFPYLQQLTAWNSSLVPTTLTMIQGRSGQHARHTDRRAEFSARARRWRRERSPPCSPRCAGAPRTPPPNHATKYKAMLVLQLPVGLQRQRDIRQICANLIEIVYKSFSCSTRRVCCVCDAVNPFRVYNIEAIGSAGIYSIRKHRYAHSVNGQCHYPMARPKGVMYPCNYIENIQRWCNSPLQPVRDAVTW